MGGNKASTYDIYWLQNMVTVPLLAQQINMRALQLKPVTAAKASMCVLHRTHHAL